MGDKLSYRSFKLGFILYHSKLILTMTYFTVTRNANTLESPKSILSLALHRLHTIYKCEVQV